MSSIDSNMTVTIEDFEELMDTVKVLGESVDLMFVLICGILCFLLQAGFGLLEVGSVRSKNAQNIMLKNLMDAGVSAVAYWVCGYAFAYGKEGNGFIGSGYYLMINSEDYIEWFFNYVFAGTATTIVSGAVAERCQFRAYLVYSFVFTGFMYPVATHWIWGEDGFLFDKTHDFAGGGAVHMVGGAAAMAGSYFLGPRLGKFLEDPETGKLRPQKILPHNIVLASLGGFILWLGFFPFNAGSTYTIAGVAQYVKTGRSVLVTTLGGASGGITLLLWGYLTDQYWDISYAINGLLAGIISTCSGADIIDPIPAFLVGIFGAIFCQLQILLFENVLFIDDPLNASAVHLAGGAVGMIAVGFFANPKYTEEDGTAGIFYGGDGKQLAYQLYGMVAYFFWAFGISSIVFYTLKVIGWFRVSEEEELEGIDITLHGKKAYNEELPVSDGVEQSTMRERFVDDTTNDVTDDDVHE